MRILDAESQRSVHQLQLYLTPREAQELRMEQYKKILDPHAATTPAATTPHGALNFFGNNAATTSGWRIVTPTWSPPRLPPAYVAKAAYR